ncbi:MAG: pyridoxal-phosphate dependent enzyme [Paracoccaceae bacterium]
MRHLKNPYVGTGLTCPDLAQAPWPSIDKDAALALLSGCPKAGQTPLINATSVASDLGVESVTLKDERSRMGLGSFKALGAAYVIACDAQDGHAAGQTYVTASAGNHGLSVAAGAAAFGAKTIVYLSKHVPEAFADRLRSEGAQVERAGETYEDSMEAAAQAATQNGDVLLSDSSWPGYYTRPHRLMEGYLALMSEVFLQIDRPPTHIFLQAGVGGLAGAAAAVAREEWGSHVRIVVVEPEEAPALIDSVQAGRPVVAKGQVSLMGRLDCKEPSLIALKGLSRDANDFVTISEDQGASGAEYVKRNGWASTPSGAAGVAAALCADKTTLGLDQTSRVLCILSEGPET